jgi:hypothetical protein
MMRSGVFLLLAASLALAACAEGPARPRAPVLSAEQGRARVSGFLPPSLPDRDGWAADIYAAFTTLDIVPNAAHICAVVAVAEQESGLRANPSVPDLPRIARREIDRRAAAAGIPALMVSAALMLPSTDGRTYGERLSTVRTERDLSLLYEEMIGRVPLMNRFLADRNPVRTAGPMQVSVAFAEAEARRRTYPYPVEDSIRHEVFTRRGGLYFGIAHLLAYEAPYDRMIFRFADFNAGRYASRNAAFQRALARISGIPLAEDGDLIDPASTRDKPGATERAARAVARRIGLDEGDVRGDLEKEGDADFGDTDLALKVFAAADKLGPPPVPRAIVPSIRLVGPKISRQLTTAWYADRVDTRYRACLARGAPPIS